MKMCVVSTVKARVRVQSLSPFVCDCARRRGPRLPGGTEHKPRYSSQSKDGVRQLEDLISGDASAGIRGTAGF